LFYAIDACKNAGIFSEIMVSTDSGEIAEIAKSRGAAVPFMRSERTSDDFAYTYDVIEEVVNNYNNQGKIYDILCCVYPCVPFLLGETLKNAYRKLTITNNNALHPVCKYPAPIEWAMKIKNDILIPTDLEALSIRSQDLQPKYYDAGMFYFIRTAALLGEKTLTPSKTMAFVMDEKEVQDIDTPDDWEMAELKYRLIKGCENG